MPIYETYSREQPAGEMEAGAARLELITRNFH
jgi:hypothetical protein